MFMTFEIRKNIGYPQSIIYKNTKQENINAFAYNPSKVVKPADHQTGIEPKKRILDKPPLMAGKRISKNGKVYYEYRRNRSSLQGRLK